MEKVSKAQKLQYTKYLKQSDFDIRYNFKMRETCILVISSIGFYVSTLSVILPSALMFLFSLMGLLLSYFVGNFSIEQSTKYAYKYYLENDATYFNKQSKWTYLTKWLNHFSIWCSLLGILSFTLKCFFCIG